MRGDGRGDIEWHLAMGKVILRTIQDMYMYPVHLVIVLLLTSCDTCTAGLSPLTPTVYFTIASLDE